MDLFDWVGWPGYSWSPASPPVNTHILNAPQHPLSQNKDTSGAGFQGPCSPINEFALVWEFRGVDYVSSFSLLPGPSSYCPHLLTYHLWPTCLLPSKGILLFFRHFLIHPNKSIKIWKSHLVVFQQILWLYRGWISSCTHPKSKTLPSSFFVPPNAGNCSGKWSPSPTNAQRGLSTRVLWSFSKLMGLCAGLCTAPVIPGNGIPFPSWSCRIYLFPFALLHR